MKRLFQAIPIAATVVGIVVWSLLRTEEVATKTVSNGPDRSETHERFSGGERKSMHAVAASPRGSEQEGWEALEPAGRFESSKVLDKAVAIEGDGITVARFLVEMGEARRRLVLVEQHYDSPIVENALSLVQQYAFVGDEIIFEADPFKADLGKLDALLDSVDAFVASRSRLSSYVQVKLRSPTVARYFELFDELSRRFPEVVVSRDNLHFTAAEPSEYSPALHWHLDQIKAPDAWEFATGSEDAVVAVIDTGCLVTHPDIEDNLFVNAGEVPGNGVDDDGNGFVDDVSGWDFLDDDSLPDDETGHGTHVSGIAGATGDNGFGTTGVGWRIKILPLKVGDSSGLSSSAIAEALRYVTSLKEKGVNIVATNNSYGSNAPNNVARAEIKAHEEKGVLFVAAAGNAGQNIDESGNSQFPAGFTESNIISVANSTQGDDLSFGSNYGTTSVDIAAPGQDVYSTYRAGGYEFLTGTSMASPMVAGALALLASHEPDLSATELRQRLFDTAERFPSLEDRLATGGRLDLLALLEPELAGHAINVVSHEPHLVFLPDTGFPLEFELEALEGSVVTLQHLGNDGEVVIEEVAPRTYSVQFGKSGLFPFRISAELRGITRVAERLVVVGSEAYEDVTNGLIHSWRMQGSGAALVDSVGSGNGEVVGANRVDTPLDRGLDFSGSSSFARFNASFSPVVTLSAFVKSDDLLSSPHPRILNLPDYYLYISTRGIADVPDGNANTLKFYSNRTGDFGVWNSPPDTVIEGEWMHVLASYDSRDIANTPQLYINGREMPVRIQRIPVGDQTSGGGEAYLGDRADGDRAWDGQMDEVRVYNRLVGRDEVSVLASRYAAAVWNQYTIAQVPGAEGTDSVSLALVDRFGNSPNAQFEWSLADNEGGVTLSSAEGSAVELSNPNNVNTRILLKATSSLGTRYYRYDFVAVPPVIDPGVYTGTTSGGGTVWLEVENDLNRGAVTIIDTNSGTVRIRESVLIDSFGKFDSGLFSPFRITGNVDGVLSGEIADAGLLFSGENIKPSSSVDGFAGFYGGGVIENEGETLEVRVLETGEAFLWRSGVLTELRRGQVSVGGEVEFEGDGFRLAGRIDAASGSVRGELSAEEEVSGVFLRRDGQAPQNRYVNLSTRGFSGTGENVLIGGFVLAGREARTVLIRGIGPDLESRGVANFLPDPLLRLFRGSEEIGQNDDWSSSSGTESLQAFSERVGASALVPESGDAALLLELDPGLYTVFLDSRGVSGEGLFEVFDDPNVSERALFNVSTRGRVSGESLPLIAGFVVTGQDPKPVLIRALGPELANRGVSDPLSDPRIEVFSEGRRIAGNDDWSSGSSPGSNGNAIQGPARTLVEAFTASGATALDFESKDAALLVWLEPGLYTAIAVGPTGEEGIALIEVYEVN